MEVDVVVLDCFPEVASLHLQFHQQQPRIIVRLGQLWPVARGARLPDHALDHHLPRTDCIPGARATCVARA
jgi:hypothetical protein